MFRGKSIAYTTLTNIEKLPLILFTNGNFDRATNILTIFKDYWTVLVVTLDVPIFVKHSVGFS